MKKISILFAFILLAVFVCVELISCKKDEKSKTDNTKNEQGIPPEIHTLEATYIPYDQALFKGSIVNNGKVKITDYGFIYGTSSDLIEKNGVKISLGSDPVTGDFSKKIEKLSINNSITSSVYVRAYLTYDKGTILGRQFAAAIPEVSIEIGNLYPLKGQVGDTITIKGKFYGTPASEMQVTFAGFGKAKVIKATDTTILAEVPLSLGDNAFFTTGIPISVFVGVKEFVVTHNFLFVPTVSDFEPKSGPIGTIIQFSGYGLTGIFYNSDFYTPKYTLNNISFSGTWPGSGIRVAIPAYINSNNVKISVQLYGVKNVLPQQFIVTKPVINSITPSAKPGGAITLYGVSFPYTTGYEGNYLYLKLNDIKLTVKQFNADNTVFNVPDDILPGAYTVTLVAGPNTVQASQKFIVN